MIYFDAAYIAKCYLNEPGADRVREIAYGAEGLASCELARLEFASILKRHVRERHVTRREMTAILKDFQEDEQNGVWQWFSVTSALLEKARKAVLDLPSTVFVRSGDALHLACAEEHGFEEVYTNDPGATADPRSRASRQELTDSRVSRDAASRCGGRRSGAHAGLTTEQSRDVFGDGESAGRPRRRPSGSSPVSR